MSSSGPASTIEKLSPSKTLAGRICWLPSFQDVCVGDEVVGLDEAGYDHPVLVLSDVVSVTGTVQAFLVSVQTLRHLRLLSFRVPIPAQTASSNH
jgi:hypothetical protein